MAVYLGNQLIGNGLYLGATNYNENSIFMSQSVVSGNPVLSGRIFELNTTAQSAPLDSNTWRDVSGNGYNFAQTGSATYNSGSGWTLNGSSQYLLGPSTINSWFTGSLSSSGVTMFVNMKKTNDNTAGNIVAGWNDSGANYKILLEATSANRISYAISNQSGPVGNDTTSFIGTANEQRIMMLSYNPNDLTVWNNNIQMSGSMVATGTWSTSTPVWSIGARFISGYSNFFGGSIKAALLYNRALNSTERTQVYNYLLSL